MRNNKFLAHILNKKFWIEYFITAFGIVGGLLMAQRIDEIIGGSWAKFILGAFFVAAAALLTVKRDSKFK